MNGAIVRRSLQALGDELGSVRPAVRVGCAVASFVPDDSCFRLRGGLMRAMGFDIDWSSYFASVPKFSGAGPLTDRLRVGRHCYVNVGCHFDLSDRITIGDRVAIGQQVLILTSTHELGPETSPRRRSRRCTGDHRGWRLDRCSRNTARRDHDRGRVDRGRRRGRDGQRLGEHARRRSSGNDSSAVERVTMQDLLGGRVRPGSKVDHDDRSEIPMVDVSIVIPTYNRRDRLRRVLEAVENQRTTTKFGRSFVFEVIVVSDGSTDGTSEMVQSFSPAYDLCFIEQANAGPAAARNAGVSSARGTTILFIDDDVIPGPDCVRTHVARHDATPELVVIGPMLTPTDANLSPWVEWEQFQLYKQYERFASGSPAYPRQFYTGNASLPRKAFEATGGFNTEFRRAEDVELAQRLELLGLSFIFEPSASATHYAERSMSSWLGVAFDYGFHDVAFARGGQPWMRGMVTDSFNDRNIIQRTVIRSTLRNQRRSASAQNIAIGGSRLARRLHLSRVSRQSLSVAYGLNYYAGVVAAVGSPAAFERFVDPDQRPDRAQFSIVFVLEQTLGHITHGKNLTSALGAMAGVDATIVPVEATLDGRFQRLPGWSNWTVRAGLRARHSLRRLGRLLRPPQVDAMFVHSQVPAVLLGRWMKRIPTVVSLDATPRQYDELGLFYEHSVGPRPVEAIKFWANQRCFRRARHIVTWSEWAKSGVVSDYGVAEDKVTVIAPGVQIDAWAQASERATGDGPLRILFVGGNLKRKGGELLIEAAGRLRSEDVVPPFEVHLVTSDTSVVGTGIIVHNGLGPNSPDLIEQYRLADIFCLPTLGDCLPMVLAEAGAAGLPLISTDVGAIRELVRDGETGRLIPPGELEPLVDALRELLTSADVRRDMGQRSACLGRSRTRRDRQRGTDRRRDEINCEQRWTMTFQQCGGGRSHCDI